MPKVVDHQQRRTEIAAALWRVVDREGIEGVSARTIAAESGWSLGAVRHYFATQDELIHFAATSMAEGVRARALVHLDGAEGPARAAALLSELLPLDARRTSEARVWLALLARARVDPALDGLRQEAWAGERLLCRIAVADLWGLPWGLPWGRQQRLPRSRAVEREADDLHTWIDGLTVQGVTVPEEFGPARLRHRLRVKLAQVASNAPARIERKPTTGAGGTTTGK